MEWHFAENGIVVHLSCLGFGPYFEEQLRSWAIDGAIPARVVSEHRGTYEVWSNTGAGLAHLAGRLRAALGLEELPGVGDWVLLREPPGPDCVTAIDRVFARRTAFIRGAAGREVRAQVVAANVDLVFVVCGLDADFNIHRVERYVARIWASGARPAVVLNKADLCDDAAAMVDEIEGLCPAVPVHLTSALRVEGLEGIRAGVVEGVTAAFVGSSGAGKSTLVNALLGEERMVTREVRARNGRGSHTTSHRQLLYLPGGGLLLDTPGMRELQLLDEEGLGAVFEDIEALSSRCRFGDCRHDTEPGCAVREAVAAGEVSAERLEHYQKLAREALAYERRHDERLRRQAERGWGQLYREADRLRRWKSGE